MQLYERDDQKMNITVNLSAKTYDIIIERGAINRISDFVSLDRKVMVISDTGVPAKYVEAVLSQCKNGYSYIVQSGEEAKSLEVFKLLCEVLLQHNFNRKDLIVAVGGGVVGDLSGFVAASYMRGISFVNIPTTTLSQIDSSIGGKVGINLDHVKNIVGAFYHPEAVIVDSDTLATLPERHYSNGLAEAVKAGLIYDSALFDIMENQAIETNIDEIIRRCLLVKKDVVEKDEKEQSLRKILNFGHTIGHGIESVYMGQLFHGEAVALGMLPMIGNDELRERVIRVLERLKLKSSLDYDKNRVYEIMCKDKKSHGSKITIVKVNEVGKAELCDIEHTELKEYICTDRTNENNHTRV